jgi:predicted house-cleaning NTP pyrophosphatase (Maf/HAM1 superfamily)
VCRAPPPQGIAEMLAKVKAEAVGGRRPDCVVIGASSAVRCSDRNRLSSTDANFRTAMTVGKAKIPACGFLFGRGRR